MRILVKKERKKQRHYDADYNFHIISPEMYGQVLVKSLYKKTPFFFVYQLSNIDDSRYLNFVSGF